CGPVHLDCAPDVTGVPSGAAAVADPGTAPAPAQNGARDESWDAWLSRARKPMLLVGLGARRPADAGAVRSLAERRRIPAMVTYKAKGVIPDDHPRFAGAFTNAAIDQPALDATDLLIGVGLDPVELIPRAWTRAQPIVSCGPVAFDTRHVPFASQVVMPIADA